jgi:hypothetical protein
MLREGTAAYLNALSSDVSFDLTTSEVEALIEGAVAGGDAKSVAKTLAGYNHQACPLN